MDACDVWEVCEPSVCMNINYPATCGGLVLHGVRGDTLDTSLTTCMHAPVGWCYLVEPHMIVTIISNRPTRRGGGEPIYTREALLVHACMRGGSL